MKYYRLTQQIIVATVICLVMNRTIIAIWRRFLFTFNTKTIRTKSILLSSELTLKNVPTVFVLLLQMNCLFRAKAYAIKLYIRVVWCANLCRAIRELERCQTPKITVTVRTPRISLI